MSAFLEGLRVLRAAKPKWGLTQEQAQVWAALLSDLPPDALLAAAAQLARETQYDPTPAEWRDRALTIAGSGKVHALTATEAWDELMRNRRTPRRWRRDADGNRTESAPKWSSEAVRRAAESVQWDDPTWLTEQIPTIRAQFRNAYQALADKRDAIDAGREALALVEPITRALAQRFTPQLGGGKDA